MTSEQASQVIDLLTQLLSTLAVSNTILQAFGSLLVGLVYIGLAITFFVAFGALRRK